MTRELTVKEMLTLKDNKEFVISYDDVADSVHSGITVDETKYELIERYVDEKTFRLMLKLRMK